MTDPRASAIARDWLHEDNDALSDEIERYGDERVREAIVDRSWHWHLRWGAFRLLKRLRMI